MEIGLLSAFLGGVLSLLSPCGALLLPGFFAARVGSRAALLPHGVVYSLGLLVTLVPLGVGAGALGALVVAHRGWLIGGTSLLLVVLGVLMVCGVGVDLGRWTPVRASAAPGEQLGGGPPVVVGGATSAGAHRAGAGWARTFLLGATGGIAGFCAGPILGAVLTLALGQGGILVGAVLLAAYGAGMVVPLMLLAAMWSRLGPRARGLLRGRTLSVGRLRLHTISVLTGVLTIALGVLFWATNGLVTMPSLIGTETLSQWQQAVPALAEPAVQIAVVLALGVLALVWWWLAERRRRRAPQPLIDLGRQP